MIENKENFLSHADCQGGSVTFRNGTTRENIGIEKVRRPVSLPLRILYD